MDVFAVFFLAIISVFCGIILTLTVQYYVVYVYFKKSPEAKPVPLRKCTEYDLPENIKKQLEQNGDGQGSSGLAISLVLQFLFHELRHSESVKRWLYKRLSLELDELINKTTMGKLFECISIKDMHLGTQFPDIKNIAIDNVKLDKKEGHVDTVSLRLDLDYSGGFLLCLDAKLRFGKTAYLSIKVNRLAGKARLQFTRHPYTHWSFSFFNDPILELAVESHFQGRQLQSNITNLIVNQIKKAVKRKHTLPNYKIRYKPFFVKTDPSQLEIEEGEIVPQGRLDVTCAEVSRLSLPHSVKSVYCTLGIGSIPWISLYTKPDGATYMTLEVTLLKSRQDQLGVIFRQDSGLVIVDSVSPNGNAHRAGLKANDIILAVDNKVGSSIPQVAKLIRATSSANVALRIERFVAILSKNVNALSEDKEEQLETAPEIEDVELTQTEQDTFVFVDSAKKDEKRRVPKIMPTNENVSKLAQTIGNFTLRKRKSSVPEKQPASDRSTPASSGPGTPQHTLQNRRSILTARKNTIAEINTVEDIENMPCKSQEHSVADSITFDEDFQFNLTENSKYLNINVWAVSTETNKDVLLGYANIPIGHVLAECCGSVLGHYVRRYSLLPPVSLGSGISHPLLSHSGFEQVFCYGDVLFSFVWSHDGEVELKKITVDVEEVALQDGNVEEHSEGNKHDFVRTQFHRTTHCDFCSKKIWLKDAVQCRRCGLCCHKKCLAKCQLSGTACTTLSNLEDPPAAPEITTTAAPETDEEMPENLATEPIKRVNSANSLALPGVNTPSAGASKSLPPSPQRRRSLAPCGADRFAGCPAALEEVKIGGTAASESIERLLERLMSCPSDDTLMDNAKESGRKLYADMAREERLDKINLMMGELKRALDTANSEHSELARRLPTETVETERARLAFLMGKADAKVQALSALMLHYCAGLQCSQENKIV